MTLRKPYSEKQQEYIDSVDGNAHMSAVGIIGELEARDKEHLAKIEKQTKTILNQADKIADFVKYFEGNECRKGLTAKPCHCEAPKKELSTLKQSIDESHRRYVPVDAIGFKAWNLTKDSRAIANDVYGQSITVALLELKDGE